MKKTVTSRRSMLVLTIIVNGGLAFYAGSQYLTKPADGLLNGDKKLLYVPELRSSIAVFETVWTPREKNNLIRKKVLTTSEYSCQTITGI